MDIRHQFDLQTDLPVFVRATPPGMKYLKFAGRQYSAGDHLPWQELGIDYDIVKMFMDRHYLYHSDEKTVETKVGDGLDLMTWDEMNALVDTINAKVKKNTASDKDFHKYKCKKSKIREKQMGLLRSWRRHYGKFEAM
jgi:hypothetical protein